MISEIRLRNFKLFEKLELQTELITVLIGPNGSGKSTVLQSLQLMKQLINRATLRQALAGHVKLGDFSDVLHQGATELELGIAVAVDVSPDLFSADRVEVYQHAVIDNDADDAAKWLVAGMRRDSDVLAEFAWLRGEQPPRSREGKPLQIDGLQIPLEISAQVRSFPVTLVLTAESGLLAPTSSVTASLARLDLTLRDLKMAVQRHLNHTFLVPALRGFHRLAYVQSKDVRRVVDLLQAEGPDEQARLIGTVLGARADVRNRVSGWTQRITQRSVEFRVAPDTHFALDAYQDPKAERFNIVNEGFATNQLIHPLTQLAIAPHGSTVEIEEPEIHLHPKAQAELVRVLVEVAKSERKQLLLTTHSEHVLMALVTEVAKGTIDAEELALYYLNREGDRAVTERLEVTSQGQVKGGLKGFFDVEIDEMQQYLSALARKG